jgi:hypothetical protein
MDKEVVSCACQPVSALGVRQRPNRFCLTSLPGLGGVSGAESKRCTNSRKRTPSCTPRRDLLYNYTHVASDVITRAEHNYTHVASDVITLAEYKLQSIPACFGEGCGARRRQGRQGKALG